VDSNSRYKCGGINFIDGKCYWIADANGPAIANRHDRGIFVCDPKDITDTSKHTLLFNPMFESANMLYAGRRLHRHALRSGLDLSCGIIWSARHGQDLGADTTSRSSARAPAAASTARTATAGSAWTCAKAGSSAPRSFSSNLSPKTCRFI
jgi:hypothetical protein